MFTGLVEGTGQVVSFTSMEGGGRLVIDAGAIAEGVKIGDSVAINGCCLTVVLAEEAKLGFDLLVETEARTNLRGLRPGTLVNLERALPADGRCGGHFVTGHVDGLGKIIRWERSGKDHLLDLSLIHI